MDPDPHSHEHSMLIAFDGTPAAVRALEYAGHHLSTKLAYILTAWEPIHRSGRDNDRDSDYRASDDPAHEQALEISHQGIELAQKLGFDPEPFLVESDTTIWGAIVDAADELDCGLIVLGTRGVSGLKALVQPSVSDNVLKHSGRPVLIVPPVIEYEE